MQMKNLEQIGGHARQGDVLLRRIRKPQTAPKPLGNVPLARGEATGHHHSFGAGAVCYGEDAMAPALVELPATMPLTHQEHAPIEFPAGSYERLIQVEDTGAEVRAVAD
jgi:hypothetical protein